MYYLVCFMTEATNVIVLSCVSRLKRQRSLFYRVCFIASVSGLGRHTNAVVPCWPRLPHPRDPRLRLRQCGRANDKARAGYTAAPRAPHRPSGQQRCCYLLRLGEYPRLRSDFLLRFVLFVYFYLSYAELSNCLPPSPPPLLFVLLLLLLVVVVVVVVMVVVVVEFRVTQKVF